MKQGKIWNQELAEDWERIGRMRMGKLKQEMFIQ